jgi:hypothetical protein
MLHKWIEGKVCLHRFSVTNFSLASCPLCLHCEQPQIQQIALGQCCSHNASTWLPNLARGRTRDCTSPLCAKSSRSRAAHEHATKQGAYLLSINRILMLWVSRSRMPFLRDIHKQTALPHGSLVIIYEPWTCHELEKFPSRITPAYEPMNLR